MRTKRIKKWFSDNWLLVTEALTGFCVGTTIAYWTATIHAAFKGLKIAWVPRK